MFSRVLAAAADVRSFVIFTWKHFDNSQCRQGAAALTYTSLFALVPMMTVCYVVLSFMPQLTNIQGHVAMFIFSHFLPDTGYQIWDYLQQFSSQARKLTGPGIIMLVITSLMMLKTIEGTFNTIWDVRQGRRGVSSFLLYWAVLSLGPVLAGAGFMASTYLLSLDFLEQMGTMQAAKPLFKLLPLCFTVAALTLVYTTVPNCRVPLRHASIGALAAGASFELAKKLFALSLKHSSYKLIYGAFASVPLFLLWIYTCWMIVLAGAVLVHCIGIYRHRNGARYPDLLLTLIILQQFWLKQQQGLSIKANELIRGDGMGIDQLGIDPWHRLGNLLLQQNFIRTTAEGDYILARDLHTVSLWDLASHFGADYAGNSRASTRALDAQPWFQRANTCLAQVQQQSRQSLSLSLAELYATR